MSSPVFFIYSTMANESTTMHTPGNLAPTVSGKFAHCEVCGISWQILSTQAPYADALGCIFCYAGKDAITVHDESDRLR